MPQISQIKMETPRICGAFFIIINYFLIDLPVQKLNKHIKSNKFLVLIVLPKISKQQQ